MNNSPPLSENDGPQLKRIGEAFAEMPLPPVPSDDETFARVMAAANEVPAGNVPAASSSLGRRPSALGTFMRVATPLAAAAAIAVVLFVSLRPGGGSVAFADVQERLAQVRTATFRTVVSVPGMLEMSARVQIKDGRGMRQAVRTEDGVMETVIDIVNDRVVTLMPDGHAEVGGVADFVDDWGGKGGRMPLNLVDQFLDLSAEHTLLAGHETREGRDTLVYVFDQAGLSGKVWVDRQTRLPVHSRYEGPEIDGGGIWVESTGFTWDVPMDDTLFEAVVPEGYTVEKTTGAAVSWMTDDAVEADFLRLLNVWAELGGGRLPEAVDPATSGAVVTTLMLEGDSNEIHAGMQRLAAQSLGVRQPTPEQLQKYLAESFTGDITGGMLFLMTVAEPRGFAWARHDGGVARGDAGRVVCFWRAGDGEDDAGYRVVYGDLRVEASPTVPELPAGVAPKPAPTPRRTQELLDRLNQGPAPRAATPLPPRTPSPPRTLTDEVDAADAE